MFIDLNPCYGQAYTHQQQIAGEAASDLLEGAYGCCRTIAPAV